MSIRNAYTRHARGFTAVEVLIGVALASVILIFAANTVALFINAGRVVSEKTKALYLVEEGLELIRFVRDESWSTISSLSTSGTHYLGITTSLITTTTTPEIIGGFRRSFTIQNVYRNTTTSDIVASTTGGSVADTSSKYITLSVAWGNPTTTISMTSILADIAP
jgi:prepilin-type N-terminal cleavage/methylation domain-containing protein